MTDDVIDYLEKRLEELEIAFDLRHRADMRAIKKWQEAHPGKENVWPDSADLCIWLMEELEKAKAEKEDMKIRNQVLRKRSDIPLHRTEDYNRIDKHLSDLRAEIEQLKGWKESALAVEREWNEQAIAKLLGAKLGESCRKVIKERVPQVVAELAAARERLEMISLLYDDANVPRTAMGGEGDAEVSINILDRTRWMARQLVSLRAEVERLKRELEYANHRRTVT